MISPNNGSYKIWRRFIVLIAAVDLFYSPILLAFLNKSTDFSLLDTCMCFFLWINLIINFHLAYKHDVRGVLVFNKRKVALKYMRGWFLFDLVASIPLLPFQYLLAQKRVYILLLLPRLFLCKVVHEAFTRVEKKVKVNYYFIRLLKVLWVTSVNLNSGGCLLYLIASLYHNPEGSWVVTASPHFFEMSFITKYITSIYWAMTTFATVGYGDLHATNNIEMITIIFYMLWNMGLVAYLLASFSNLIQSSAKKTQKYRDDLELAKRVIKRNNVVGQLQERFLAQVTLEHVLNIEALEELQLFSYLHKPLQSAISQYQHMELVKNNYLFKGVSTEFLVELMSEMKHVYLPPHEEVITRLETSRDFYLISAGGVELIGFIEGNEEVFGKANLGDLCGEISVFCFKPQMFTVKTNQVSRLLRVDGDRFLKILQSRVVDGALVIDNFIKGLQQIKRALQDINNVSPHAEKKLPIKGLPEIKRDIINGALQDINNVLAHAKIELPIKVHYSVLIGDNLLLEKWLNLGSNANERDIAGRTPLHIAVLTQNIPCITTLLNYGAHKNCEDLYGRVPMWDALLTCKASFINNLKEKGFNFEGVDVCEYAKYAITQNSIPLLEGLIDCNGDIIRHLASLLEVAKEENNSTCDFLRRLDKRLDKRPVIEEIEEIEVAECSHKSAEI